MRRNRINQALALACLLALTLACNFSFGNMNSSGNSGNSNNSNNSNNTNNSNNSNNANNVNTSSASEATSTFKDEKIGGLYQWGPNTATEDSSGDPAIGIIKVSATQDGPEATTIPQSSDVYILIPVRYFPVKSQLTCRVIAVKTEKIRPGDKLDMTLDTVYDGYTGKAQFILPKGRMPKGMYKIEALYAAREGAEQETVKTASLTIE